MKGTRFRSRSVHDYVPNWTSTTAPMICEIFPFDPSAAFGSLASTALADLAATVLRPTAGALAARLDERSDESTWTGARLRRKRSIVRVGSGSALMSVEVFCAECRTSRGRSGDFNAKYQILFIGLTVSYRKHLQKVLQTR